MINKYNKRTFIIIALVFALVSLIVIFVVKNNGINQESEQTTAKQLKSVSVSDLKEFVSQTPLPRKDLSVKRSSQKSKDFVIEAATTGNIDSPITFAIKGGKIAFTSLPNQNLGSLNDSSMIKEGEKTIYQNLYNGINLIYTPSSQGILEEYEVRAKREINYLIQKIDISGLTYKSQQDGSIVFTNQRGEFAFAIPKPVMYEKFNTKNKNFDLHYEIFDYEGNTYLAKVIDPKGKIWLSKSNYPVMIDATILLTLYSYHSYSTIDGIWQVSVNTVGSGDFKIYPAEKSTWSVYSDTTKDLNLISVTCNGQSLSYEVFGNGILIKNFSCPKDLLVSLKVNNKEKQDFLGFEYSGFTSIISSVVLNGKPLIVSSSLTPPVVKIGDTIMLKVEVIDENGVEKVTADMGGVEKINLSLGSGNKNHGAWEGKWIVHNTATKPYEVLINASNNIYDTSSSIGFFDPYTCTGGGDHAGASWNPATDCPGGFAGNHTNIGTASVGIGETATVTAFNQVSSFGIATISASTVTIAGTITATGQGWAGGLGSGANGAGPGGGTTSPPGQDAGGGGYGGAGATGSVAGGGTYGSFSTPGDLGSGGGAQGGSSPGGAGGGSIKIVSTGTLTISGTVEANGVAGTPNRAAGGSGGSIYFSAATLAGNGTVSANGGNGGGIGGAGGGGGRVSINYSVTNSFSGSVTSSGGSGDYPANPGTAYILGSSTGDLIIPSGNGVWNGSDRTSWTFGNLTINGNVTLQASNATLFTLTATGSSTIASSVTIAMKGSNTTNSNGVGVFLNLTGNITIPATSTITANAYGYAAGAGGVNGAGPGGGTTSSLGQNAGGGGYGGAGASGDVPGGSTYGSLTAPLDLGSGGGAQASFNPGGAGGGAIRITTTGTLTVDGSITANGAAGTPNRAAGGSGGSIYLNVSTIAGSGTITASGGNGGGIGGSGGGGGRVSINYTTATNWTGNSLTASGATAGGTGDANAANGTVYYANSSIINSSIKGNVRIGGNVRFR